MTIVIDPTFSVYRLLERINQGPLVLRDRRTMTRISYTIENATRSNHARNRIFLVSSVSANFCRRKTATVKSQPMPSRCMCLASPMWNCPRFRM